MADAHTLIELAFEKLAARPGYTLRPDQKQLALLLSDAIEGGTSCAVEAPTGLGKSLASLIAAIAQAVANKKRTIIATYTNVLAEQYGKKDLPFALELMEAPLNPAPAMLIGRSRYLCLLAASEGKGGLHEKLRPLLQYGIESEVRKALPQLGIVGRDAQTLWQSIKVPPVCQRRACPLYHQCFYYKAQDAAKVAPVVITNHSVVLQDAQMKAAEDDEETVGQGLLGAYSFVIFDEAHDLPSAAQNAFEFELSEEKLQLAELNARRFERLIGGMLPHMEDQKSLKESVDALSKNIHLFSMSLKQTVAANEGILGIAPLPLADDPMIQRLSLGAKGDRAKAIASEIAEVFGRFEARASDLMKSVESNGDLFGVELAEIKRTAKAYLFSFAEFQYGAALLANPQDGGVSYAAMRFGNPILRHDLIEYQPLMKAILWDKTPTACVSATLMVDGELSFFSRLTGANPLLIECLPSPFDFEHQASVYLPPAGRVMDSGVARQESQEAAYYTSLAYEIRGIIDLLRGRTLVLFPSRLEMEEVHKRLSLPPDLPVLMQPKGGAGAIGERFRKEPETSLLALRSFWTGFDAPGETLSCVVVVRIPFETPFDPAAAAKAAMVRREGLDPFADYTLPVAKLLLKQGAGRLIRTVEDRGIIAILDPRVRTKRYGESILENLPPGMRTFDDIRDAAAQLLLGG